MKFQAMKKTKNVPIALKKLKNQKVQKISAQKKRIRLKEND